MPADDDTILDMADELMRRGIEITPEVAAVLQAAKEPYMGPSERISDTDIYEWLGDA